MNNLDEDIKIVEDARKFLAKIGLIKERDAISNLLSELETYKKIEEKLADALRYYNGMQQVQEFCIDICEDKLCDKENCKQCIIEYFRKKVEKDE